MTFVVDKPMQLVRTSEGFEPLGSLPGRLDLDPAFAGKLADFLSFLQEIEEYTAMLRRDQLEALISQAMVAFELQNARR
ncbi:MAG TPA: hypothetical protein VGF06_05495, partial [Terriglobales bacterium]